MSKVERLERWIRPLAVFSLLSMPILWWIGFASRLHIGPFDLMDTKWAGLVTAWGVIVTLSLTVSFFVAVVGVATDKEMKPSARVGWIVALMCANLAAGAVFVIWRWFKSAAPVHAR